MQFVTTFVSIAAAVILGFVSVKIFHTIYHEHGTPYIDEIFHIPQAQLYCQNRFTEWDPKITTLPGLYLISYFLLKPFQILGYKNICSVYNLRLTNIFAAVFNLFITLKITECLEKKYKTQSSVIKRLITAINITTLPPLYFYTFLYYTDVWSVTFILLLYYSHLTKKKFLGFFSSIIAVLIRQTNIIWVGFMILDEMWLIVSENFKTISIQDYKQTKNIISKFYSDYFTFKKKSKSLFSFIYSTLSRTYHYVIVCVIFCIFVVINGSIVLGDKDAHTATFHPMQNLYFLNFVAFFGLPFFISEVPSMISNPPNFFLVILLTCTIAGLSEINKLEHPYLLADNRHLAFYLWKRFFGHAVFRRLLVPTYVCSGFILLRLLQKKCHFMIIVSLFMCTFLNLTPQYLFELRYFIIPYIMFRLQFKSSKLVLLESILFTFINVSVCYLFLNRSFTWPSEPQATQRIIW